MATCLASWRTFILLAVLVPVQAQAQATTFDPKRVLVAPGQPGQLKMAVAVAPSRGWYVANDSSTVFVFVHGIFSNPRDCFTSAGGVYWPQLLRSDSRFGSPSIYLGSYHTDFSSGLYRVQDAATELLSYMRVKDPRGRMPLLDKQNIVFIAHSTGGLVVRYLLERNQDLFKSKHIGLVLLASPSRGSAWADRLKLVRKAFHNKMAGQLQRDNDFVDDLDRRFSDLVRDKRLPGLVGTDLFENDFVVKGTIFNSSHVVSAQDSTSYFGSYHIIPGSDHFTIAKPTSLIHPSHQYLLEFYESTFLPSLPAENGRLLPLWQLQLLPPPGRRILPPG